MSKTLHAIVVIALTLALAELSLAQQIVRGGPPPEIKSHIDAFIQAFNSGNADEFEKMTATHYSPDLLKKRTAADRKRLFERMQGDFGKLSLERVERRGPDAPLQLFVKGSTGTAATIVMDLDPESPFLIAGLRVEVGGGGDEPQSRGPAPPDINSSMSSAEISTRLDNYFAKLASADTFSGVVLVAKSGNPVFQHAYGFADRGNKVANTIQTRFNLGSINKAFTQVAIAQLVDQGKLSLSDTVGKWLPDYPQEETRAATIAQLLNHTGGIADFFGDQFASAAKDRFRSNEDYFRLVSSQKPLFAPGKRNQYCNGCYITLGAIIARVSSMPYEKYIAENVYKPAGMATAGPVQTDAINENVAVGYTRRSVDDQLRPNIFMHGAQGSAAGGGFATAADLLAFDSAMRAGRFTGDNSRPPGGNSIAGGAPGCNSVLATSGEWTVIVLSNFDPPTGERLGEAVARALQN
jgi:D-alanyl-D-alanine carboxypeptidase